MMEEPSTCVIIAGGWSVAQYGAADVAACARRKGAEIIAVNSAAFYVEPNDVVTMDRVWLENCYEAIDAMGASIYYRRCTVGKKSPLFGRITERHTGFLNNNEPGAMSPLVDPLRLEGNNSGACALNLAYVRRYARIYLFGFDMQKGPRGENHFYHDYSWNPGATKPGTLEQWAGTFAPAAEQFRKAGAKVYNVNNRSLITDFKTISIAQFRGDMV